MKFYMRRILMSNCKLHFSVTVECDNNSADDLGKDLAIFLQESFFNGEDIVEVEYNGHDVL